MAMENGHGKVMEVEIPPLHQQHHQHRTIEHTKWEIGARIMAAAATLTAACIALTNNQTVVVFSLQFQARYSYTSAFKFLVAVDFITIICSILSLIVPFVLDRFRPSSHSPFNYFYLFLHDLVVMTLLMGGCGAASAEGYLGKYGNSHSGWLAVCDQLSKFCNRMAISLTLSYLAFALYLALTVVSAYKSRQIQPSSSSS